MGLASLKEMNNRSVTYSSVRELRFSSVKYFFINFKHYSKIGKFCFSFTLNINPFSPSSDQDLISSNTIITL